MSMVQAEPQQRPVQDTALEDAYESVASAAEEAYEAVREDVEGFFRNRNAGRAVLQEGLLEIRSDDDEIAVRFIGEEYVGDADDGCTTRHQYLPLDRPDMMEHVQEVYAPLTVAGERIAYALEHDEHIEADQLTAAEKRLSGRITAEDATDVLESIDTSYNVVVERPVYRHS